jgi:hypothetical protein
MNQNQEMDVAVGAIAFVAACLFIEGLRLPSGLAQFGALGVSIFILVRAARYWTTGGMGLLDRTLWVPWLRPWRGHGSK